VCFCPLPCREEKSHPYKKQIVNPFWRKDMKTFLKIIIALVVINITVNVVLVSLGIIKPDDFIPKASKHK